MTAQIGDIYKFEGKAYSIVALESEIKFKPSDYGLIPEARCSACWDGYWCEYVITDKELFLENLHINTKDQHYPEINGVNVQTKKKALALHPVYENIHLPIRYTGQIVAGLDFLQEYYIHMGYQRAWAYKKLVQFIFENGALIEVVDHSEWVEKLRAEIKGNPNKSGKKLSREEISRFVTESFSLDFADKFWWLDRNPQV